jgi:colanic acid/amylovoran biosynthesis glycosyltransferase
LSQSQRIPVIQSVSKWLPQTATWLHNQVRLLPPEFESHIVCEATMNLDQFPQPRIHSLDAQPMWRYVWDKGMRKLGVRNHLGFVVGCAREAGARLLHSHFGDLAWRDIAVARMAGVKHVVTFYGIDVVYVPRSDPRWPGRYQDMFSVVERVLCEGPFMAQCLVELGCPQEKVSVHHLGIDLDQIPFQPRTWHSGEPLRVLLAGSFREKKGFPYALEALGRIKDETPLEVTVIGDANNERTEREKKRILETIETSGLSGDVRMLGYQPYDVLLKEAGRHHVFLSPSVTAADGDSEGGAPVSIIEMCASGMAVVSTTHCDIPGVILNGVTGLLAEERDVDGLVTHLRYLIANPDRWSGMLVAARKHVEAEFAAKRQGQRLGDIYRDVLATTSAISI